MPKALKGPYLCPVHGRCHGCAASDKSKPQPKPHTKWIFDRDMMGHQILRRV